MSTIISCHPEKSKSLSSQWQHICLVIALSTILLRVLQKLLFVCTGIRPEDKYLSQQVEKS